MRNHASIEWPKKFFFGPQISIPMGNDKVFMGVQPFSTFFNLFQPFSTFFNHRLCVLLITQPNTMPSTGGGRLGAEGTRAPRFEALLITTPATRESQRLKTRFVIRNSKILFLTCMMHIYIYICMCLDSDNTHMAQPGSWLRPRRGPAQGGDIFVS